MNSIKHRKLVKGTDLFLVGRGGWAAEVIEVCLAAAKSTSSSLKGVFDNDRRNPTDLFFGLPYLGDDAAFISETPTGARFFVAVGDNAVRRQLALMFVDCGKSYATVIHPTAVVSSSAVIGDGVFIGSHCFVGPRVQVSNGAIINVHASVGHDSVVGAFAQLCPGVRVSGSSRVGEGAILGSNSVTAPGIRLGDWSKLSAGSFACRDVPPQRLAMGVPAKLVL